MKLNNLTNTIKAWKRQTTIKHTIKEKTKQLKQLYNKGFTQHNLTPQEAKQIARLQGDIHHLKMEITAIQEKEWTPQWYPYKQQYETKQHQQCKNP